MSLNFTPVGPGSKSRARKRNTPLDQDKMTTQHTILYISERQFGITYIRVKVG